MSTLFYNLRLVTPKDSGRPLSGPDQARVNVYDRGAILVDGERIVAAGDETELRARHSAFAHEENLGGRCVIPGFVDPHTHMCFAARRENEFQMRLQGKTYLEILEQGGGILSSVKAVRAATDDELVAATRENVMRAFAYGTTTVEIKSGYGLDNKTEMRMLNAIARVAAEGPVDVVPTYMGAHAVPQEHKANPDVFVDQLIADLPEVAASGLARFCDVFCEEGVFSIAQGRRLLLAAREHGLGLKIHADEVHNLGGAALAAEVGALSAEHLLAASDEGLTAMAEKGVVAVLLPATAYSLRKPYARGRDMITHNVPVALATDCNPGSCFCESMPFVFGLAVMQMNLSPAEALVGCTLNAAYAIGAAKEVGSIEPGKQADFLVLDGETPACIPYHAGANPVLRVCKRGKLGV